MKHIKISFLFLTLIFTLGCTKKIDVGDFDSEKWITDRQGCNGDRIEMIDDVI
ncbi:MAG: hypothetical protein ACJAZV_000933, partial [Roseivirga sp.]